MRMRFLVLVIFMAFIVGCDKASQEASNAQPKLLTLGIVFDNHKDWQVSAMKASIYFDKIRGGQFNCQTKDKRSYRFVFYPADDAPDSAASAIIYTVNQLNADIVLTPFTSKSVQPMISYAGETKTPIVALVATGVNPDKQRIYYYPMSITDDQLSESLVQQYAKVSHSNHVLALSKVSDLYSRNFSRRFKKFASDKGIRVDTIDFVLIDQQLTERLKKANWQSVDAVLLPFYQQELEELARQIRQLGFQGFFLGGDSWEVEKMEKNALYQPAIIAEQWHPLVGEKKRPDLDFSESFMTFSGEEPTPAAALMFDALLYIEQAACQTKHYQPTAIRSMLDNAKPLQGVTGKHFFGSAHQVVRKPILLTLSNQQVQLDEVRE